MTAVFGTFFADVVEGTNASDQIYGFGGNDRLKGGAGPDRLDGGTGSDILDGGGGPDIFIGGDGIDTVDYSQSPPDGSSTFGIRVDLDLNTAMFADAGGDTFSGIENVTGSGYYDSLFGDGGANVLKGLDGGDYLLGRGGNDRLEGGAGNDTLDGGDGIDTMIGGPGIDYYSVDSAADVVIESGGEGFDTVYARVSYALPAGADIERLWAAADNYMAALDLTGNSSGNQIIGNGGDNVIDGAGGVDQLMGRAGNDLYFVDNASDSITELGGEGLDEVRTSGSFTLNPGADVEILRTTDDNGTASINLAGNASGNAVRGNNGTNLINGADGNDTLTGLGGADSFLFNNPLDAAANVDTITDFNVADDTIQIDNGIFDGLALGTLAGDAFVIGTAAQDAQDRIVYDATTGALSFDVDGVGGAAAVRFATVSAGLALTNSDFLVV